MTRSICILGLLCGSVVLAQPVKKLPGGAVMKPGNPPPVVPLAKPSPMKPLEPLVGEHELASPAGEHATVRCEPVADAAWLRCDIHAPAGSAAAFLGWDRATRTYRALVVDSRGRAHTLSGRLKTDTLSLRGAGFPRVTIALGAAAPGATIGGAPWTVAAPPAH